MGLTENHGNRATFKSLTSIIRETKETYQLKHTFDRKKLFAAVFKKYLLSMKEGLIETLASNFVKIWIQAEDLKLMNR